VGSQPGARSGPQPVSALGAQGALVRIDGAGQSPGDRHIPEPARPACAATDAGSDIVAGCAPASSAAV
jgi:hypothetical protein